MKPHDDWDDDERRALEGLEREFDELRERHRDDPPIELLRAAHAGALPEPLQAPLAERLKQDAWSRALVDDAGEAEPSLDAVGERRLLTRIRGSARSTLASRWPARFWLPKLAAAAVVVVMVGVLRSGPARWFEQPLPSPAPAPVATAPSAPVFSLSLDKPEVKLTAQALVLRSEGRDGRFADDLVPALDVYRANDYLETDKRLAALQTSYPRSIEVAFYRAIALLFLNDFAGAIRSLQAARGLDDGAFAAEIGWYLAVAHERASDPARARAELESLCRQATPYTGRACEAAAKLKQE